MNPDRAVAARAFLDAAGWQGASIELLTADASFRSYYLVTLDQKTAVLMDAPPEHEKPAAFQQVAQILAALELSAPRIYAADTTAGFLLIEYFGERTFTRALAAGADERALYQLATDTLIVLHRRWDPSLGAGLTSFDGQSLPAETELFLDWMYPALTGSPPDDLMRERFLDAWREVLRPAFALPPTLVLRDYHVDNMMVLADRPGVTACGLLDFQDALLGSPAYDLVSLLQDARRDVSLDLEAAMLERYCIAFPELDRQLFEEAYWVLGAQRTIRILGVFVRLDRRDGKPAYLAHLPRLWRLLDRLLTRPEVAPVAAWFERYLPAAARQVPLKGVAA